MISWILIGLKWNLVGPLLESTYFALCACFALIDINQNGAHDDEHRNKKLHISAVPGNTRNLTTEVDNVLFDAFYRCTLVVVLKLISM